MTVPESAAAVFERVLGEHAATSRSGAECACGWTGDRSSDIPYIEEFRAHVAAQLATALAQPDTLGDGGGESRVEYALATEARPGRFTKVAGLTEDGHWNEAYDAQYAIDNWYPNAVVVSRTVTTFKPVVTDWTPTQPSATSEGGWRDE